MLDAETIKEVLAQSDILPKSKLLICLAAKPLSPKQVKDVRELAVGLGLRAAKDWNVSAYLGRTSGLAVKTAEGWELTGAGKAHVAEVAKPFIASPTVVMVSKLRSELSSIQRDGTRSFVEEAINCLEARLYRSAVVLSWVGAVAVLYDHVVASHLVAFNTESGRLDPKWKAAKTADDLAKMKEFDFLQRLVAISVIGKNVKDELEGCLRLRNGCGHPNSLVVGEHKAAAHVETLVHNVFSKF